MPEEKYIATSSDSATNQKYWNRQYEVSASGRWDLGKISPAIQKFIDSIPLKNLRILIPGCGNAYEAQYLLDQGFTDITLIDIAPLLVKNIKQKFSDHQEIKIILGDFFELDQKFDLIIEQTFFCALPPVLRQQYVYHMNRLLNEEGILAGLLFNREFEGGPPFGGSQQEYKMLFQNSFEFITFESSVNSIPQRAGTELFMELRKK